MNDILSKRLIVLNKVLIVVFAFSLVSLVHKLDSRDLERDIKVLDVVAIVDEIDPNGILDDGQISAQGLDWLKKMRTSWPASTAT